MMKLLFATLLVAFAAGVKVTGNGVDLTNGELHPSSVDGTRIPGVCSGSAGSQIFQLDAEGETIGDIDFHIITSDGLDTMDGDFRVDNTVAGFVTVIFEPVSTNKPQRQVGAHVHVHNAAGDVVFEFGVGSSVTGAVVQLEDPMVKGLPVEYLEVETEKLLHIARYGACKNSVSTDPVAQVEGQGFSAAVIGDEVRITFNAPATPGNYLGVLEVLAPEDVVVVLNAFVPEPEEDEEDDESEDGSACVDLTLNGVAWADYYGENCQWYDLNNKCGSLGDTAPVNGITANMACCVCGGGGDATDTGPICEDLTQPNGAPWYDSYTGGGEYGCQNYYNNQANCDRFGQDYEKFGLVANEACCTCGGGSTGSEAVAEEEEYVPVTCSSLTVGADNEPWYDTYGEKYNCVYYTENDKCDRKDWGGENANVHFGLTAKEACCGCGGGEACADATLASGAVWHDSANEEATCEWYSKLDRCKEFGSFNANEGLTAKQACCACKQ